MLTRLLNLLVGSKKSLEWKKKLRRIFPQPVWPAALQGRHIEIMPGSQVDRFCAIGDYTYVGYNCFISCARIGRYCSIANNISIGMGEHDLGRVSTNSIFYEDPMKKLVAKECVLGDDVWIGVDSIIRRGVTVGVGAVIGANSFVTRDVPPFAIVAGSPARFIRFRIPEAAISKVLASRWWEKDLEEARILIRDLESDSSLNLGEHPSP